MSTRIAGSFHWEIKVNSIGYNGGKFRPSLQTALTDSGTSLIFLPTKQDWDNLFHTICENTPSDLPDGPLECDPLGYRMFNLTPNNLK